MLAWRANGQLHDEAWALVRVGECQIELGDKSAAADSLLHAKEIATRLNAAPLRDAVAGIAARARIPELADAPMSRRTRHGLTDREVAVLRLVAQGNSNAEIARALSISPKTASVHVSHFLAKLDVASRSEATTEAHRLHLLTSDGEPTVDRAGCRTATSPATTAAPTESTPSTTRSARCPPIGNPTKIATGQPHSCRAASVQSPCLVLIFSPSHRACSVNLRADASGLVSAALGYVSVHELEH